MPKPPVIASERVRAIVIAGLMIAVFCSTIAAAYSFSKARSKRWDLTPPMHFGELSMRVPSGWQVITTSSLSATGHRSWRITDPRHSNRYVEVHEWPVIDDARRGPDAGSALRFWLRQQGIPFFDPETADEVVRDGYPSSSGVVNGSGGTTAWHVAGRPDGEGYDIIYAAAATRVGDVFWIIALHEPTTLEDFMEASQVNFDRWFRPMLNSITIAPAGSRSTRGTSWFGTSTQPATMP